MRVLMTGMSPPQCNRRTQIGYEHVSDLWAKALCAGGAEVNHARIEAGHPLDGYDVVLVGLIPPNSIANKYIYTACDVIARARMSGCGLVFYVDDWRFGQIIHGVKVVASKPDRRLFDNELFKNLHEREWAVTAGRDVIKVVLDALNERPWPVTLIPAFTWGDHGRLPDLPTVRREVIDPTAFARAYEIPQVTDDDRARQWIMGTFSDQRQWIENMRLTWPVNYLGTRRSNALMRLQERELVAAYGGSWGTLAAPYDHAGSGWWRNRFVYSAAAGSVMLADPREVSGLGPDYHRSADEVELMDTRQLRELADRQGELMRRSVEPAGHVTDRLLKIVRDAIDLTRGSTREEQVIAS